MNWNEVWFLIPIRFGDVWLLLVPALVFWPMNAFLKRWCRPTWPERKPWVRHLLNILQRSLAVGGCYFFCATFVYYFKHDETLRWVIAGAIFLSTLLGADKALSQTFFDLRGWRRMAKIKGYYQESER